MCLCFNNIGRRFMFCSGDVARKKSANASMPITCSLEWTTPIRSVLLSLVSGTKEEPPKRWSSCGWTKESFGFTSLRDDYRHRQMTPGVSQNFSKLTYSLLFGIIKEMKRKKDLMPNRVKRAIKELKLLSHIFVRKRDSINDFEIKGYCIDCGKLGEGRNFQAGHWIPDSVGGALLRYHPWNMNGQHSGCNCYFNQEMVKINYTRAMSHKYGENAVARLMGLKGRSIKADILFYEKMISLYKIGDEQAIVNYLESL